MSVHYKFKNTIEWNNVKFDGVYISASDLKSIIVQQKKLGHSELQLENEETGQCYADDQMIPKNTNIVCIRLPFANSNKRTRLMANQPYPARFSGNANSAGSTTSINNNHHSNNLNNNSNNNNHHHHNYHHNNHHNHNNRHNPSGTSSNSTNLTGLTNLNNDPNSGGREAMELVSTKTMSEEEKLKSIQSQSTKDFDVTHYARSGRGGGPGGRGGGHNRPHYKPGPSYTCRKCGIPGDHLIYDCKSNAMHKVKRSSGIPRDFLMKVDSKEKGALMTPSGEYAVPIIDREAYNNPKVEKAPFFEDGTPSDDLKTSTKS